MIIPSIQSSVVVVYVVPILTCEGAGVAQSISNPNVVKPRCYDAVVLRPQMINRPVSVMIARGWSAYKSYITRVFSPVVYTDTILPMSTRLRCQFHQLRKGTFPVYKSAMPIPAHFELISLQSQLYRTTGTLAAQVHQC